MGTAPPTSMEAEGPALHGWPGTSAAWYVAQAAIHLGPGWPWGSTAHEAIDPLGLFPVS